MSDPSFRIVVVGGGTAGWISAGLLERRFAAERRQVEIILVESKHVGRIGVGEASFPTLRRTLAQLEVDERDFMRAIGATFKHAVRFVDWSEIGQSYYHTFEALLSGIDGVGSEKWIAARSREEARPYAYEMGMQAMVADAGRCPKTETEGDYRGDLNYAYHVDADLLGDYLQEMVTARGVRHLRDDVRAVRRDPDGGDILGLTLADNGTLDGDFFIDCTGFASVLHKEVCDEPFVDFGQHLLCDRAVAFRLDHDADHVPPPYTVARALEYGWAWNVGLQSRSGQGYVYSSAMIESEEAEKRLRLLTGAPDEVEARHLRFRTGRAENSWNGNCVAIGLSGGFIEPLESTGIHLIEEAARTLCRLLTPGRDNAAARQRFNRYMAEQYDEIRDFIVLHYCVTRRRDTAFWKAVTRQEHIPDSVSALLEIWQSSLPAPEDLPTTHCFPALSYHYVLFGMDWLPEGLAARYAGIAADRQLDFLDTQRLNLLRKLPTHADYLAGLAHS